MRILIVADVHSNLAAFGAVLIHAGAIDRVWSLGDLVGYGPDPGACIALLRSYPHVCVVGNHDLAAAGSMGTAEFNPAAAEAAIWTAAHLNDDERAYLKGLPLTAEEEGFALVHGSLRDPVWEYLLSAEAAAAHLDRQGTPYGLVGHSHIPFIFEDARHGLLMQPVVDGATVELGPTRFVANPGGLGQPRDADPRAAYAVLDTTDRSLTFHRVEYDIALTQARMQEAGLPAFLSERLSRGR